MHSSIGSRKSGARMPRPGAHIISAGPHERHYPTSQRGAHDPPYGLHASRSRELMPLHPQELMPRNRGTDTTERRPASQNNNAFVTSTWYGMQPTADKQHSALTNGRIAIPTLQRLPAWPAADAGTKGTATNQHDTCSSCLVSRTAHAIRFCFSTSSTFTPASTSASTGNAGHHSSTIHAILQKYTLRAAPHQDCTSSITRHSSVHNPCAIAHTSVQQCLLYHAAVDGQRWFESILLLQPSS
jgi:hypothetical protein